MEVIGVRVEMPSNQPIVLLKEIDGSRFLPIWVGAVEATAIAFAQQGVEPPRPLTRPKGAKGGILIRPWRSITRTLRGQCGLGRFAMGSASGVRGAHGCHGRQIA